MVAEFWNLWPKTLEQNTYIYKKERKFPHFKKILKTYLFK